MATNINFNKVLGLSKGCSIVLSSTTPSIDPDAQAFITAAAITDPTQQSAINTLVVDLKGYNVWSKMKALYPFCGSTAAQQKYNLKDPRDLDAAFRLVFSGGITHSANGALFNGINGFADTKLATNGNLTQNSTHFSAYSRTNNQSGGYIIANGSSGASGECKMFTRWFDNNCYSGVNTFGQNPTANADSRGLFIANRISATQHSVVIRGTKIDFSTTSSGLNTNTFRICSAIGVAFDNKEIAFSSIGDGLTAQNMTDLTTAVNAFQTTLGRSIGTQTVSDADAQAFVTNAGIVDQVEANAVNNLVIGLKADSLWTKFSALYPFVGGTATTHKFNLKNPLDTNAAFRLVFSGGGTHSANGYQTNGVNAFAETYYNPSINLTSQNSNHISIYSRTNNQGGIDMGGGSGSVLVDLELNYAPTSYNWNMAANFSHTNTNSQGHYINTRTASNAFKLIKNGSTVLGSSTGAAGATKPNITYHIGKRNYDPLWANRQYAFASIGDGLSDTEAANFYTAVQAFQTTLGRQI